MDGPVKQGFAEAGTALDAALDAVNRLRDMDGVHGPALQTGGYLAYAAGRLGEALHGLGLARQCANLAQEQRQGDLFKFKSDAA